MPYAGVIEREREGEREAETEREGGSQIRGIRERWCTTVLASTSRAIFRCERGTEGEMGRGREGERERWGREGDRWREGGREAEEERGRDGEGGRQAGMEGA